MNLLTILAQTYRSDASPAILEPAWTMALQGLSEEELRRGLERTLQEHTSSFMPAPGYFRTLALEERGAWTPRGGNGYIAYEGPQTPEQRHAARVARELALTTIKGIRADLKKLHDE